MPPRRAWSPAEASRLGRLAARQDDVLSRAQLREVGITRHRVRSEIRARRWMAVGDRVVVLHTGSLSRRQQWWVAALHAGERSALCGLTAAESLGLRGYEVAPVHVLVERGVHVPELRSEHLTLEVHETRRLSPEDLHPAREPRRTRFPRSIVDAASDADDDLRCMALLAGSVQQRRTRVRDLRDEVERTVRIPRRRLILETLDDIQGGAHSIPEIEFSRGLRAAGLPEPTRQRILRRPDGRYYLDASWDHLGRAAEIDGGHHLLIEQRVADDSRRNLMTARGIGVLHFTSYAVRHMLDEVIALLRETLDRAASERGLDLYAA